MKKFVSMFLVLIFCVGMFVGCGSQVTPAVEEKIVVVEATAEPTVEPTEEPVEEKATADDVVDMFFTTMENSFEDTDIDYYSSYEDNNAIFSIDLYNMKYFWLTDDEGRESIVENLNAITGLCYLLADDDNMTFSVLVYDTYADETLFVSMNGEDITDDFLHYLKYGY